MKFKTVSNSAKRPEADLTILPFFKEEDSVSPSPFVPDLKEEINALLESGDFDGKKGATLLVYLKEKPEKRLLFLGMGEKSEADLESVRRSFASAIKYCREKKWAMLTLFLPKLRKLSPEQVTRGVVEGITLSSYLFEEWKSESNQSLFHIESVTLVGAASKKIVEKVVNVTGGVNLARDLVNRNALDVTPQTLAEKARQLSRQYPLIKTQVLGKNQLEKEGMGLLLAVGSGSQFDPALIIVEYRNAPVSKGVTMLVGKGVTFDTGGLNLKPTKFIEDMRSDMGGAASVLGTIQAAAANRLKTNIVGVIPTAENAIGSKSYRPGDVYRSYSGKSVEITNTDAEGRLILADAISYGQEKFSPDRIIDLATLTGAVVVSLGTVRAGLFSNDDKLAKLVEKAGEESGERVWRLPIDEEYRSLLESEIADICNASKNRYAGAITAALFLKEFVLEERSWVHLDIAGTAFLDRPEHYHLTLATGAGVRLLFQFLETLSLL